MKKMDLKYFLSEMENFKMSNSNYIIKPEDIQSAAEHAYLNYLDIIAQGNTTEIAKLTATSSGFNFLLTKKSLI
ncbi:hypothetical protein LNJ08_11605 [Tenacibaculum finnmarkense genomovar ulcerans]|uniref:hypothetical protein n=1 Tax=Tenacibaculum finnmarkense TaxID=2781243 RepID=UPI00187B6D80|nr:hypothetical protein [Tenacibaculum finnmarkense]MBE7649009.1 hypothetical protein [Tenacibaculum finnmarkense genomovar ulcerans]MCD8415981.1 hypothetical protein [Tenacibaculum dicentrarchi]MCD8421069.1 hypothetical protein [Tenacibaculum dicentrarchi]MCD8455035.1 hypothetical protein [Tenacibaculum finnmarkense genomovar ulcerans]